MRFSCRWLCALFSLAGLTVDSSEALSAEPEVTITRVEEDWVAFISRPDSDAGAPQITNIISPTGTVDNAFGLFELNHRSSPSFRSGGIQAQSWVGDFRNDYVEAGVSEGLKVTRDKLEYTVVMEASSGQLKFSLKDGKSKTWGRFPRSELTSVITLSNPTLAEYTPQVSVENTSINVGAHRVALMAMSEVRYYSGDSLVKKDETVRYLHRFKNLVEFVSLEEYEKNEEYFNIEITE